MMPPVASAPPDRQWLREESRRLLAFSKAAAIPGGGFGLLDTAGRLPANAPINGVLTCRKIHCYALATALGDCDGADLVDHGLRALREGLRDSRHGGWYKDDAGEDRRKEAYLHAFVALAASTATSFGHDASDILKDVVQLIEMRFWSEEEGAVRERFAADWTDEMDYRGANANMHMLEAFLALHDATGDPIWLHRGRLIVETIVGSHARPNGYAVIEHFDRNWNVLKDFNADRPFDDLRPFGTTPGHYAEWAHLLLRLDMALAEHGNGTPASHRRDAEGLFEAVLRDGWKDEPPGIVYTVGWDGEVSVENRPHWVIAEAAVAAEFLSRITGETRFAEWRNRFWSTIRDLFVDETFGSWWNEVDGQNRPSESIYRGKPDLYHAYQALLAARLPLAPTYASAVRRALG
ncbi:AGE family epimerase/isomerase [Notoacmeibacter sp. MSK16QG-6]|uniref:AGE family epimerase/isomerase n=1 Tax=Notoacmeibacter sp. MSK16QG-6 TaxID=2957982 RepID=UPI00209FF86B|nr:AGE family epimerase/isomerase [Notoacmeibacter sp. MSK16QG-6]MCP1200194.1 AGE family epimerase/isomerase [Notoacmeibacter sp. MSK16QG-6]